MIREHIIITTEDIERVANSSMESSHKCSQIDPKGYRDNEYVKEAVVKAKKLLKRAGYDKRVKNT